MVQGEESGRQPQANANDPEVGNTAEPSGEPKEAQQQDDGQAPLDGFFKEVAHIKGLHESIRRHLSALQDKHARTKTITRSDKLKGTHRLPLFKCMPVHVCFVLNGLLKMNENIVCNCRSA